MDVREQDYQRVYAQIDLDAILLNIKNMKRNLAKHTQIMGIVKADGYGHGSIPISKCLEDIEYIYGFGVATAEEGLILRKAGIQKPILILGYTFSYSYKQLIEEEIRFTVFRMDQVRALAKEAANLGKKAKVHIKIDTGMSRIGILPNEEGIHYIRQLKETKEIEIEGIFTHFFNADGKDAASANTQLKVFQEFCQKVEQELEIQIPLKHCSNSAGTLRMREADLEIVRAGISLYGLCPSTEMKEYSSILSPALSLYSHIVYIKTLYKGQSVSYGAHFTAANDMRIATIPVGYGDGYPRSLSEKGEVLICGKKAPILGRVCMDQFMVDVTDIKEAKEGDRVTLIGIDGQQRITVEDITETSGRFHYEVVCDLGKRIPRVYIQKGNIVSTKDYYNEYLQRNWQ